MHNTGVYMKITEMITEWRKGCSCCDGNPIKCEECTLALIKAIDTQAFVDETIVSCDKIMKEHSGIAGVCMAAAHMATSISIKKTELRARNESTNTKD